ncbi:MAG: tetratricopeptide repeat protein, partial [Planctomycetes bacterium]|nr:tetratricopeptide repeat protein [Planctomycetota bacterium]
PVFTPRAPEFADALFLLGDLLNKADSFERAIGILEEAIERYPRDRRVAQARFLLAECYRQSGLALAEDYRNAATAATGHQLLVEREGRLRKAADLFGQIVGEYERRAPEGVSALEDLYLRHGRLYEADCFFELKEYAEAAKLYERAAWVYKDSMSALAAYVQIIQCHMFLGRGDEASAALRRAQYLVRTLPKDVFGGADALETREDWQSLFDWMVRVDLF